MVLDGTTPGAVSYLWTPGNATSPTINVDSTGIGLASQEYVVEVIDGNGCMNSDTVTVGFFDCTGIDEIAGLEAFNIFPNPNDGKFTLGIRSSKPVSINIKIFSNSGTLFFEQENVVVDNRYQSQITLPTASAGIYFVVLESDGKKVFQKVLIRK